MGAVYSFLSKKQRVQDSFGEIADDVMQHWVFYRNQNKLNEFIRSKFPDFIVPNSSVNLLEDLNAISQIEKKLNIERYIVISSTLGDDGVSVKWSGGFYLDDNLHVTSLFESEAIARIVNILNYLCFKYKLSVS